MKTYFLFLLFLVSAVSFAQNNHIVKTEDGRRVLLKADFTWEYIDLEVPSENNTFISATKPATDNTCNLAQDFIEPKLDKKIQSQLKKGRATMEHVKKKVARDYNCDVTDVVLMSASEKKASASYTFCANGTEVIYKRNGHAIVKKMNIF